MDAIIANRGALAREMTALVESGASSEDIKEWHQTNAPRHRALMDAAMAVATRQKLPALPLVEEVRIPGDASEAMEHFLTNRAELHNSRVALLNAMRDATKEQRGQALKTWQMENAATLEAQIHLAKRVAEEKPVVDLQVPDSPIIPRGASPELVDFLTQRHAMIKEHTALMNQYRTATPEDRHRAVVDWHKNNATRMQQMRDSAVDVSE